MAHPHLRQAPRRDAGRNIEVAKDEEQLPLGNDAEQRQNLEELSRRRRRGPYAHFLKGLFGFVDGLIVKTRTPEAGIPNPSLRCYAHGTDGECEYEIIIYVDRFSVGCCCRRRVCCSAVVVVVVVVAVIY